MQLNELLALLGLVVTVFGSCFAVIRANDRAIDKVSADNRELISRFVLDFQKALADNTLELVKVRSELTLHTSMMRQEINTVKETREEKEQTFDRCVNDLCSVVSQLQKEVHNSK
jgi:hypothetical protein